MAAALEYPPARPGPSKQLTDQDFHSGTQLARINELIQELQAQNPEEYENPEFSQAKDLIFSLLSQVQQSDGKLAPADCYRLLSGGVQQGTVHVEGTTLDPLSPGLDYDTSFTLLVPVLNVHEEPVTLDMTESPTGYTRISLEDFDEPTQQLWAECICGEEAFLCAELVSRWFSRSFSAVAKDLRIELRGRVTSVIVCVGSYRVLYDILPVVTFWGWPETAHQWLMEEHFWDGKLRDEDVIAGFYLFPSAFTSEWQLAFSASELHLRRLFPPPLWWSLRAITPVIPWSGLPGLEPYHLFTLALWYCERLPSSYPTEELDAAHVLLHILDDLTATLAGRCLPNYFLPQWNLLQELSPSVTRPMAWAVAQVRADPAGYLQRAVEEAEELKQQAEAYRCTLTTPTDP
ncbi:transmembrane protein 102 [Erythrolamprus reginae]|uniref:transmembrane protein 102 n=1 Tax=Erythrolamprus reginae TaxID=121349 RepID=UPI00396CF883